MGFVAELKRRNVFRVGIAYVVLGWVVLQAADFALDLIDAPNWVIQVFFIGGLLGLPFVLFFAWAYEMTPEGLKREEDVDRTTSITPNTGRKIDKAIIFFLVLAVSFLLLQLYVFDERDEDPETPASAVEQPLTSDSDVPSIAVLPFVDMSPEGDQAWFSDGISEEILNVLVKTQGIKVAGRTSSFQFRGRNEDLRDIGQQLGVENILEGSVRKAGDQIRVTAQLVKAEDGFHLWSETYDRKLDDVFAIQDEISRAITEALAVHLELGDESLVTAATQNMDAYQAYLAARSHLATRTNFDEMRALLSEATKLDPEFAEAWAALAQVYALTIYYETANNDFVLAQAEEMANRALALDPNLSQAHSVLGDVFRDRQEYSTAMGHYVRALELNPLDIEANQQLAQMMLRVARYDLGLKYSTKSAELDPLSWINQTAQSLMLYQAGRTEESRRVLEKAFEVAGDPRDFQVRNAIYMALSEGDFEEAKAMTSLLREVRRQQTNSVFFDEYLSDLVSRLDDREAALELIRAESSARYNMGAYSLWLVDATWAAWFDDMDLAADLVMNAIGDIYFIDGAWLYFPILDKIIQHRPELFYEIVRASKIDTFWRDYGFPENCRAVGDDDFECDL